MRKILLILPVAIAYLLCGCNKYDAAIDSINNRLDVIEKTTIPTIDEQIAAVKKSIEIIRDLYADVEYWIVELVIRSNTSADDIAKLQDESKDLEALIASLREYIDSEIKRSKDDAAAAYATWSALNEAKNEVSELKGVVATIEDELDALNSKIDDAIKSLNERISELEERMANVESAISELLKRIQSISYIPRYEDNKATMKHFGTIRQMTLDFEVSPKSAVDELAMVWSRSITAKAVYTETRAISFIDLPIKSFQSDSDLGIISILVSGENLSEEFYLGQQKASVALSVSDGNNSITTDYIPMVAKEVTINELVIPMDEIWYSSYDNKTIIPYAADSFSNSIVSNLYENGFGVILFDSVLLTVGNEAFQGCNNLTEIAIPEKVTKIGSGAFRNCNRLASISLQECLTTIADEAFRGCENLATIAIPNSVTAIGTAAFKHCSSITRITIPERVNAIKDECFAYCKSLATATIPNSVTSIGKHAFAYCSALAKLTIGSGVTQIGNFAFCDCTSLQSVIIPDNILTLGDDAFSGCASLSSLTIGKGVTKIGDGAFYDCKNLRSIYCKAATPPTLQGDYVFDGSIEERKIYVPTESVDAYKSAWAAFANDIEGYEFE